MLKEKLEKNPDDPDPEVQKLKKELVTFNENIGRQNQAAIESSPTAQAILQLMSYEEEWSGSSSQLHKELKVIVEKSNLQVGGSDGFPKSSNWLWKRIMQIRPNLLSLGIKAYKTEVITGSIITLSKTLQESQNAATTATVPSSNGDMAAMAANSPTLEEVSEPKGLLNTIPGLEGYR